MRGLTRIRYTGLAGAVLLAVAAYLVARPDSGGGQGGSLGSPSGLVALAAWLSGTGLLVLAWSAAGRERPDRRWLAVTGVLWALPLLVAPPLASRDLYAYACQGALQHAGLDPYRHGAVDLPCPWLSAVPPLWRGTPTPYGPLWLGVEDVAVAAGGTRLPVVLAVLRVAGLLGAVLIAWYGQRLAALAGGEPARALWLGALSPVVLVHAVSGGHNDALMVGLMLAGLVAATDTRQRTEVRTVLVGVAFGLAVAIKVTALVGLPFAALLVAGTGRWRRVLGAVAATGAAATATFALLAGLTGRALGWLGALSDTGRLVQWTSLPSGVGMAVGYLLRLVGRSADVATAVAVSRLIGLVTLAVAVGWLWWWARRRAADPAAVVVATGAALTAVALLSPVFYPWYAIAPLAVLAAAPATAVRDRWLLTAGAVLAFLVLPNGLGLAVLTKLPGALLDVAFVTAAAVWLSRRRAHEANRTSGRGPGVTRAGIKHDSPGAGPPDTVGRGPGDPRRDQA
ncbi:MAG TPA: polyprenol phosphomannose-dependent alpha 1,6 mannosyltransferase MptB [Micromonosporaceae bacterium]